MMSVLSPVDIRQSDAPTDIIVLCRRLIGWSPARAGSIIPNRSRSVDTRLERPHQEVSNEGTVVTLSKELRRWTPPQGLSNLIPV